MPYETQGPTPLLPALAGLASAYFNVRKQMQDVSSEKTNQAATRAQYGLGPNDQQLPNPLTGPMPSTQTQPVNPADFSQLGGTATKTPGSTTPPKTSFNPDPRSGSIPSNRDEWLARGDFIQNALDQNQIPMAYRPQAQEMITDAYKRADEYNKNMVTVMGPDGQLMLVNANTAFTHGTPSANSIYTNTHESANTAASIAAARNRQQSTQDFVSKRNPIEFRIDPETGNLVPVPSNEAYSQDKADVRSQNSASNKKGTVTFNEVQSMYNEWSKGANKATGQDAQGNTIYQTVPPSDDERDFMAKAIDAIQSASNPTAAAAAYVAAFKKTFYPKGKPDQEAIRILHDAAKEADGASGGSNAEPNPHYPGP